MKFWFTYKIIEIRLKLQTFEEVIRRMPINWARLNLAR